MTNAVTVAAIASFDSSGAPTYGAQVLLPARIELSQRLVRSRDGSEVVSSHVVYTQSQIGIEDAIWLPGDSTADQSVAKYPIRVDAAYDRSGNFVYWKITL